MGFPEHWTEELAALESGYEELRQLASRETLDAETRKRCLQGIEAQAPLPLAIDLAHVAEATPGRDIVISAAIAGDPSLTSMRLRYRHLTQFEDYQSVDMIWDAQTKRYAAAIPGPFINPQWDLMYFVEVRDAQGRSGRLPHWESEQPYVIVPVKR